MSELKLGDIVEVLHGAYKGKTGTIVGMMVLDQDYAGPYYEVNMDCEVEERHKFRKSLINPSNIIGGVIASDIKLIGHYGEFKVGGKVRICSKEMFGLNGVVVTVTELFPNALGFDFNDRHYICCYSFVEPYSEPTEQTEAKETFEDQLRDVLNGVEHQDFGRPIQTAMINLNINDWDAYTAELAKEVALKVANKYNAPEQAAEYAVSVAKAVVENLKNNKI